MPKTKISEFSATPGNNTDIDGINIAEGCAPSGINDAIRELMAQLKDFQAGTAGDSFNGPVGTTTAAAGAFTTLSATGATTLSSTLAFNSNASVPTATAFAFQPTNNAIAFGTANTERMRINSDGNVGIQNTGPSSYSAVDADNLVVGPNSGSNGITVVSGTTGTGNLAFADGIGTGGTSDYAGLVQYDHSADNMNFFTGATERMRLNSSGLTLNGGTANGVAYLNGSKVLTTGSALTFDGTNLGSTRSVATAFSGTNPATWANGIVLTNSATPGAGVANLVQFAGTGNVNSVFGVAQGSGGYGDFVWASFSGSFSEQMRLTSTGLGIGTSSPSGKLSVVETAGGGPAVRIQGDSSTNVGRLSFTDNGVTRTNALLTADNSGNLAFATNGTTERMRLDSSGNLGIGTSSPGAKLDVNGGANSEMRVTTSGSGYLQVGQFTNGAFIGTSSTDPTAGILRLGTGGTTRATIDTSGNLGLGVTPSAWGGSYKAFNIVGSGSLFSNNQFNTRVGNNLYHNGTNFIYNATGFATYYSQNDAAGTHAWYTAPSGTAGNAISFTQAMTLDASGNLGVGTTSPNTRLEVLGGTNNAEYLRVGSPVSDRALRFSSFAVNGTNNIGHLINAPGLSGTDGTLAFATNSTERARITSGGDLLVGVTTAAAQGGFTLYPQGSSGAPLAVWNRASTTNTTTAADFRNGSTSVGSITYTNTATAYNTSSDYRLKDNPQPLTNSGAFIDALQPKTWEWKTDGSRGVGFIAHEVQAVSPSSVVGEKDAVDADGKPVMQAMEYGSAEFIANIIAELQSLRQRVAALEAK